MKKAELSTYCLRETAPALFIRRLSAHALGYVSCYLHRGYFAFGKIKHVWLFGRFVHSARKGLSQVRFQHKKFCEGSVFEMKHFMKGPFLWWNILWRVCFWDETFCEGSVFEMKNCVKGPLTDPVLPLDWPLHWIII